MAEAYPEPAVGKVVGGWVKDDPRPTRLAAAERHGYLRKLRSGAIDQPGLSKIWDAGAAIMRLSGEHWANPIVMLFVAGYYGHVAHLLLRTAHEDLRGRVRADMAEALPRVAFPRGGHQNAAEVREQLTLDGFDDLVAHEAAAQYAAMPQKRRDRDLWSINVRQYAAFLTTWKRITADGLDMMEPVIATAQFITERAEYDVAARDKIVSGLIRDALITPPGGLP